MTSPTQVRSCPTGRVPARDRRAQYVDAAADITIRSGVAMVTMEAVAGSCGVNKALVYRQFGNRGELLLALFDRETAKLDRRIQDAVHRVDGFEAKVGAWVQAWLDHIAEHGRLLGRLMEARTVAPEVATRHRDRLRNLEKLYGDWYAGELGLPREVGRDACAVLFAGLGGVIDRWVVSPTRETRDRLEQTYVDLLLGGFGRLAVEHRRRTDEPVEVEQG